MKIDCQLDYAAIQPLAPRPVNLALHFTAPPATDAVSRPACAFALVIDRSGSMGGAPLDYARAACHTALKHVRAGDWLALVQFDTEAQVVIPLQQPGSSRAKLAACIEGIKAGGSTNLSGGWMLGRDELKKAPTGVHRRLLLLTDGQMNHGIIEPQAVGALVGAGLEKESIRTACLGFGEHYDEELLRELSKRANGEFHDADGADKLPAIFRSELVGLQSIRVANLRVRVRALDFCERWVQCSDYHATPLEGGWTELAVGDLVAEEQRVLVLGLDVLALPLQADGTPLDVLEGEKLLELQVIWDEVGGSEVTSCRHEQVVRIQAVQRAEDVRLNEEVVAVIAAQIAGRGVDAASRELRENRLEEARARVEALRRQLLAYGCPDKLYEALRLVNGLWATIQAGGFDARSSRTTGYHSKTLRRISSSTLWTAPQCQEAPSLFGSVPPSVTPPPAPEETSGTPGTEKAP